MVRGDYILPRPAAPSPPPNLVVVAATAVSPDERAYQIAEIIRPNPANGQQHRYQYILLTRGDRWAEYVVDIGPTSDTPGDQFCIVGAWEHSVAELQDMALQMRYDHAQIKATVEPRDLWGDWRLWLDEKFRRQKHQSTFGIAGKVIRG